MAFYFLFNLPSKYNLNDLIPLFENNFDEEQEEQKRYAGVFSGRPLVLEKGLDWFAGEDAFKIDISQYEYSLNIECYSFAPYSMIFLDRACLAQAAITICSLFHGWGVFVEQEADQIFSELDGRRSNGLFGVLTSGTDPKELSPGEFLKNFLPV